ncbi:unnamed protein product [Mytilus coruscus]|uniref:Tyr recombinase domain-containing protein n=1 Tax=Mytilus coruscus TaxID=42192 RepID=A0A6J8B8I8_MYTCO|nr:unnamed protein product [Mytilus coruscus]
MADHTTAFCSIQTSGDYQSHFNKSARQFEASIDSGPTSDKIDKNGRTRVYFKGEEICNNFNTVRGCFTINCQYRHVCTRCNLSNHSHPNCRVAVSNKGGEQNIPSNPLLPSTSQNSGKHIKNDYCKDPLESDNNTPLDRLSYILNSVKKLQKPRNKKRLPITFEILEKIIFRLRQGVFTPFIDLMLEAVCTVGFYGFMRCGEFTVLKANQFDPSVNLCIGDIMFHKDMIVLKLKQSKTDPFRKGIDIQLHKVQNQICPFKILVKYLQVRESLNQNLPSDPLFISQNSLALERNYFINCIKQVLSICGFNPDHYNGHSLRIGAATTAGKAHIEDHLVKILGRWSSDSYCRYIRVSSTSIKHAQDLLGKY